ncbi:MAG: type 1 glutamine amidotransferase domain-containing protein [Nitrososphaerales archaeon]
MKKLEGTKVVFLVADMTHDEELNFPKYYLEWEGAKTLLAGTKKELTSRFGRPIKADILTSELENLVEETDGVIIPGGFGPDKLRIDNDALNFVRKCHNKGKVIAAICHGAQVLISAEIVKGKKITCVKNVAIDVKNAGGIYVDEPIVKDGNLITSRNPSDLPPFTEAIIEELQKLKIKVKAKA